MTKPQPRFTINDVLDEIIDIAMPQPPPEGSFTVREYHGQLRERGIDIAENSADRQLRKLVGQGVLETAMAWTGQRHQRVYWKPPP